VDDDDGARRAPAQSTFCGRNHGSAMHPLQRDDDRFHVIIHVHKLARLRLTLRALPPPPVVVLCAAVSNCAVESETDEDACACLASAAVALDRTAAWAAAMAGGAAAAADLASFAPADARSARDAAPAAAGAAQSPCLDGVSLAALHALAAAHAGQHFTLASSGSTLPFEALTTTQVVEAVVKPATQHAGEGGAPCSYAQLLRQQARARNGCCAARTA
jgi:hypothetical protein